MNGWYIALFLYWQWGVSGNIFVVSLFSPSTTRPPNFYPSIFVFTRPNDGWMGQHKAMVWWHQDGRNMCGIVAPGVEASFSTVWFVWVCAGTTILVSPSQQEGWILKWTKNHSQSDPQGNRCCHQEPTGSLWGMQFSFSLDVSSDIYMCY